MSNWDKSTFLNEVKQEFENYLDTNLELKSEWWCTTSEEWNASQIIADIDDLDEQWDASVSYVVQQAVMWTNTCWDICKDVIGAGDFSDYNDIGDVPQNITGMAIAALDQLAKESLGWKEILREWAGELDPLLKQPGLQPFECEKCGKTYKPDESEKNKTEDYGTVCDGCFVEEEELDGIMDKIRDEHLSYQRSVR